ncbi:MAG TPA: YggS family pyridoxal phosphate-dependent enzyme [Azoarcus taiwanensis]|nr:YggS family pyridoxal phosphate-dependent enzyme [Azoarcus taiwanensis]
MTSIQANLQAVKSRLARALHDSGRASDDAVLMAVSKTWPAQCVREAAAAGQRVFGENYVQEGVAKIADVALPELEWHFIGPLQSNKTRLVAEHFDWVHSIERLKIAQRLSDQRGEARPPLQVCVQVNVSGEQSKSGIEPAHCVELAQAVARLPGLRLRGLMCIPEPVDDPLRQRARFAMLRELRDELVRGGLKLDTLSMGMSDDLELAIAEGSTMIRVGSAIFGARNNSGAQGE